MPMSGDDRLLGRETTGWNKEGIEMWVCHFLLAFTTMSWVVLKNWPLSSTGTKYMCRPGPFDNGLHSQLRQEYSSYRSKLSHLSWVRWSGIVGQRIRLVSVA